MYSIIMELGPQSHDMDGLLGPSSIMVRLMDKILHYLKDPKLWELWYIPYYGSCRILGLGSSAVQVMIQFEDILEQRSA